MPWTLPPIPTCPAERLKRIIQAVFEVMGAYNARHRAETPLVFLLTLRLERIRNRFARLVAQFRAGSLPLPRTRAAKPRRLPAAPAAPRPPKWLLAPEFGPLPKHLPGGFAWVVRRMPHAAVYGSQLRHWLRDPEVLALLAATPRAGRVLRPLCRMLGIKRTPDMPAALADLLWPPRPTRRSSPTRAPNPDAGPPEAQPRPPDVPGLVQFITSGPVVAMVWEGEGVIASARKIIGATNPLNAEPGTIRGDYGVTVGRNLIHGSDGPETAQNEISLWFKEDELANWQPSLTSWLYE